MKTIPILSITLLLLTISSKDLVSMRNAKPTKAPIQNTNSQNKNQNKTIPTQKKANDRSPNPTNKNINPSKSEMSIYYEQRNLITQIKKNTTSREDTIKTLEGLKNAFEKAEMLRLKTNEPKLYIEMVKIIYDKAIQELSPPKAEKQTTKAKSKVTDDATGQHHTNKIIADIKNLKEASQIAWNQYKTSLKEGKFSQAKNHLDRYISTTATILWKRGDFTAKTVTVMIKNLFNYNSL